MGTINIKLRGSFGLEDFETTAMKGGHVAAIKRGIKFLADELSKAVVKDVYCAKKGVEPPDAPFGQD